MLHTAVALSTDPSARNLKRKVMEAILESLSPDQQCCFIRYYSEGLHAAQAVIGTGVTESQFRLVRDEVRRRYQTATSGRLDPQEWLDRQKRLSARLDDISRRRCITRDELIETAQERAALFGGSK
jgi:hypothetical protein